MKMHDEQADSTTREHEHTSVAVLVVAVLVDPSPVGVENDSAVALSGAATRTCALLPGELGVSLSCVASDKLAKSARNEGECG